MRMLTSVRVAIAAAAASTVLAACGSGDSGEPAAVRHSTPTQHAHPSPTAPTSPTASATTPPEPGADCLRPADSARAVHFGTEGRLGGYLMGSGDRYVVLAHQSLGDSCQLLPLARGLASAGYAALAFDFPGTDSSAKARSNRLLALSVLDAVRYCRAHSATSVSLVGASMGGYAVLNAALLAKPPVDAVVSLSAPDVWDDPDGKPLDISALRTPTQLWAARYDTSFAEAAHQLSREQPAAELIIEPGVSHGVQLVPDALRRVVAFLDTHAPAP